jgi:hypothetical protein
MANVTVTGGATLLYLSVTARMTVCDPSDSVLPVRVASSVNGMDSAPPTNRVRMLTAAEPSSRTVAVLSGLVSTTRARRFALDL